MVKSLSGAGKVTSTACILWSAYLLTRSRSKYSSRDNQMSQFPLDASGTPAETITYPAPVAIGAVASGARIYMHHGWQWVRRLFTIRAVSCDQTAGANVNGKRKRIGLVSPSTSTLLTTPVYLSVIAELTEQAKIAPTIRDMLKRDKRLSNKGSNAPARAVLKAFLTALSCFTKNDRFIDLFLHHDQMPRLLAVLGNELQLISTDRSPNRGKSTAAAAANQSRLESPARCRSSSPVIVADNDVASSTSSLAMELMTQQVPTTTVWPCMDSRSTSRSSSPVEEEEASLTEQQQRWGEAAGEPDHLVLHIMFATVLANLSRNPASRGLLDEPNLQHFFSIWNNSSSLRLTLLCEKIRHNLKLHANAANTTGDHVDGTHPGKTFRPCYYPDLYCLNRNESPSFPEFDVIFVHGMRGSVYHTWRQNDLDSAISSDSSPSEEYSKCWPRDWLSKEFPTARIIALDASLNPFLWDPVCPTDKLERTMDSRAKKLLPQLQAAEVGQRPIVWITHSAGGILVKELLRLSVHIHQTLPETDQTTDSFPSSMQADDSWMLAAPLPEEFYSPADSSSEATTDQLQWTCGPSVDEEEPEAPSTDISAGLSQTNNSEKQEDSAVLESTAGAEDPVSDLTQQTKGVIFMSAPHRGNRSLFALYRRPLRWTLTPEALQLERNFHFEFPLVLNRTDTRLCDDPGVHVKTTGLGGSNAAPGAAFFLHMTHSSFLLDLHNWFHAWATRVRLPVLSLVETRHTPIHRFWSVLLVPQDDQDREFGEVVEIDSDHMYISKPRGQLDAMYQHVVRFIRHARSDKEEQPLLPPLQQEEESHAPEQSE